MIFNFKKPGLFILVSLLPQFSFGSELDHFRYWNIEHGLGESYCCSITIDAGGRAWVNHGDIEYMSILNGYDVDRFPSPGSTLKVHPASWGEVWSANEQGLLKFQEGMWKQYPITRVKDLYEKNKSYPELSMTIYPVAPNQIWYLLPDALYEFNEKTQQSTIIKHAADTPIGEFHDMIDSQNGDVWITGQKGIARIPRPGKSGMPQTGWIEFLPPPEAGLSHFFHPLEFDSPTLYLQAQDNNQNKILAVLDTENKTWDSIPMNNLIQGWKALDDCYWATIRPTQQLWCLKNDRLEKIITDELSGTVHDVALDKQGAFWIATSQNLARFNPPVWRTPNNLPVGDSIIHSIIEDPQGRIWFACTGSLMVLDDNEWRNYPLPDDKRTDYNNTQCLAVFKDGRIAFQTRQRKREIFFFDPATEQFSDTNHPQKLKVRRLYKQTNGNLLLQTGDDLDFALEEFDGTAFHPVLDLGNQWGLQHLRYILETKDYGLWLGGTAGLGILKDGSYESLELDIDFINNGAFCLAELDDNTVWAGGRDKIYAYNGQRWSLVRTGIDKARSIIQSNDGTVWVASGNGLHRYKDGYWITNTVEDGLPSIITYEVYEDSQGRIWAGTAHGLSLYCPQADQDPPATILEKDRDFIETAPSGDIQFHFSGIDKWKHTIKERLYFSYRIDSASWSDLSPDTFAAFTNLPAGPHKFEVRAIDRNGNISQNSSHQYFKVLTVWYREPLFIALTIIWFVIVIFFTGFFIYRKIERDRLIHRLNKSEELLRETQQLSKMGGWEYNLKNHQTTWTDETYQIFELNPGGGHNLQKIMFSCFHPDDRQVFQKAFRQVTTSGIPFDLSMAFKTLKGNKIWIRTMARAEWKDGKIERIIGNIIDITKLKNLETQLIHSQRIESIANLAGGVSHNINNLLTGIIGNLNLLKNRTPSNLIKMIDNALTASHRASGLVRDLQSFSRQTMIYKKKLSINQLIQDIYPLLRDTIDPQIKIILELEDRIPPAFADEARINTILMNLCLNARDAILNHIPNNQEEAMKTPHYYIYIKTKCIHADADFLGKHPKAQYEQYIIISVRDNGIGMDTETQKHIFEPFFTTKGNVGSGLGLASSFGILEKHNGWIDFSSQYGKGSTFQLFLPTLEETESEQ